MIKSIIISTLVLLIVVSIGYFLTKETPIGSVGVTDEYNGTTSAQLGIYGATQAGWPQEMIKNRPCILGSIIVASSSATTFSIKNATTTNDVSSSTAVFLPASPSVGTYTFDMVLNRGCVIEKTATFNGYYITTYR